MSNIILFFLVGAYFPVLLYLWFTTRKTKREYHLYTDAPMPEVVFVYQHGEDPFIFMHRDVIYYRRGLPQGVTQVEYQSMWPTPEPMTSHTSDTMINRVRDDVHNLNIRVHTVTSVVALLQSKFTTLSQIVEGLEERVISSTIQPRMLKKKGIV